MELKRQAERLDTVRWSTKEEEILCPCPGFLKHTSIGHIPTHSREHTTNTYNKHTTYRQNNRTKYKKGNRLVVRIIKVLFLVSLCPLSQCPHTEEKALDAFKRSKS